MNTTRTTTDADESDLRVGRILNEFLDRRARNELGSASDLLKQHPDLADDLRLHLDLVHELRRGRDQIEDLVRQGSLSPPREAGSVAELDGYKILQYLGRGGMGIVLQAHDASLDRTVALKILRPELAEDEAALARFEREAKAAANLRHPNIVSVYAVGRERSVRYIVMEFVDGASLAEVMRGSSSTAAETVSAAAACTFPRSHVPAPTIRRVFCELLLALDAAHRAGLIHRDIKPSNILLAAEGLRDSGTAGFGAAPGGDSPSSPLNPQMPQHTSPFVKLADFGLARMRCGHTQVTLDGSVLGTPEYMSPEQARGDGDIDHRTDLYSAGVVLYEMLTGRTPFRAETPTATLRKILDEAPVDPRELDACIDPALASIALRLLAKRPNQRFASAAQALAALDANAPVRLPGSGRPARRYAFRAGVVAVVLAAMGSGAWWLANAPAFPALPGSVRHSAATIARVEIGAQGERPTVWAVDRRGERRVVHRFPPGVERVEAAAVVDVDGGGRQIVVAGLCRPLRVDDEEYNLFAFDAAGRGLWRLHLTSDWPWPGGDPPGYWSCHKLAAVDLDGEPGEELVAVAGDYMWYATQVAIVDPRRGEIRPESTFWHLGKLSSLEIEPGFFGPGHPALLSWGNNNKLDEAPPDARKWSAPVASFDFVSCFVILDPAHMHGVGPPRIAGLPDLPEALPFAYAFLDTAPSEQVRRLPSGEPVRDTDLDRAAIAGVDRPHIRATPAFDPWKEISITYRDSEPRVRIVVDRNLGFLAALMGSQEEHRTGPEYWRARWHAIIQNGAYVRE